MIKLYNIGRLLAEVLLVGVFLILILVVGIAAWLGMFFGWRYLGGF